MLQLACSWCHGEFWNENAKVVLISCIFCESYRFKNITRGLWWLVLNLIFKVVVFWNCENAVQKTLLLLGWGVFRGVWHRVKMICENGLLWLTQVLLLTIKNTPFFLHQVGPVLYKKILSQPVLDKNDWENSNLTRHSMF